MLTRKAINKYYVLLYVFFYFIDHHLLAKQLRF